MDKNTEKNNFKRAQKFRGCMRGIEPMLVAGAMVPPRIVKAPLRPKKHNSFSEKSCKKYNIIL